MMSLAGGGVVARSPPEHEKSRRQKAESRNACAEHFCFLLSAFCFVPAASAQDARYIPTTPIPLGDTYLSLPSSHIAGNGSWEVKFTHRFNQSIDQGSFSDRVHSLFGLDSNADVGIGLSYTARPDLQFSFYRNNALDDIEVGAKYIVIQQAPAIPFSAAVRAGGDWRTERDVNDRTSLFAQAILSHQFGRRAEVTAIPTYVTDAGRVVSGTTSSARPRPTRPRRACPAGPSTSIGARRAGPRSAARGRRAGRRRSSRRAAA